MAPDAMDHLQQLNDDHTSDALKRHADRVRAVGRTHCANLDCAEPITSARTAIGAQLCLPCQHEADAQDAHLNRWRRR